MTVDSGLTDLFGEFDPELVAAIQAGKEEEERQDGNARAQRAAHRMQVRRAKAEAQLAEILPDRFQAGDSWHVVSHGDIDALSYLTHALKGVPYFDYVAISTWCVARTDLEQIAAWLDAGRIDQFDLYAGEIFPSQYGDEHEYMLELTVRDLRLQAGDRAQPQQGDAGQPGRRGLLPGDGVICQRQHKPTHRADRSACQPRPVRVLQGILRWHPQH